MNRRQFVQTSSQVVTGMLLIKAKTAFGYQANSAVRHGLLGCGNRGTSVATSFSQNTTAQVVALADIFPDQLAAGKDHFDKLNAQLGRAPIDSKMTFRGPHAFEQLAQCKDVDLVHIATPPFFHVQHLKAAVEAGKHVYCEKPVGIDIRQAKEALDIAKRVKPNQSVDVGFQCRMAPPIAAIAERIKGGALGKIATVSGNYNAPASTEKVHPGAGPDEYRLRNWLWDRWDNYEVDYTYPNDVHFSFASTQFGSDNRFDAGLKLFGSSGSATVPYSGPIEITGAQAWQWQESTSSVPGQGQFAANGAFLDNLKYADRDKDRSFIESITTGPAHNQIAAGVETALSCMLGRMAGYQRREVTWDDLLAHGENYELGMNLEQFA
jgi:myo-inositol 2-dehydrogenase/D-chiro-inositol 1-dehydrogenase